MGPNQKVPESEPQPEKPENRKRRTEDDRSQISRNDAPSNDSSSTESSGPGTIIGIVIIVACYVGYHILKKCAAYFNTDIGGFIAGVVIIVIALYLLYYLIIFIRFLVRIKRKIKQKKVISSEPVQLARKATSSSGARVRKAPGVPPPLPPPIDALGANRIGTVSFLPKIEASDEKNRQSQALEDGTNQIIKRGFWLTTLLILLLLWEVIIAILCISLLFTIIPKVTFWGTCGFVAMTFLDMMSLLGIWFWSRSGLVAFIFLKITKYLLSENTINLPEIIGIIILILLVIPKWRYMTWRVSSNPKTPDTNAKPAS